MTRTAIATLMLVLFFGTRQVATAVRVCPCHYKAGVACDCKVGDCSCGVLCWCRDPGPKCRLVFKRPRCP